MRRDRSRDRGSEDFRGCALLKMRCERSSERGAGHFHGFALLETRREALQFARALHFDRNRLERGFHALKTRRELSVTARSHQLTELYDGTSDDSRDVAERNEPRGDRKYPGKRIHSVPRERVFATYGARRLWVSG